MDARTMKKKILANALRHYEEYYGYEDDAAYYELGVMLDLEVEQVSKATMKRFVRVLQDMVANAESKL